ncbi:hypothetical protein PQX77_000053 [Marasmius sp. AFHP31]|nr:hypothetical protein PQX77_000053 [Marasmius sp. AFHP31]
MNGSGVAAYPLEQRQVLGGILSGVLDGAGTLVSQVGDGVTSVVGGVTSVVGGVLTPIVPPPSSTSSTIATTTPTTTSATSSSTPTVSTTSSTSETSTFETSSTSGRISSSSSSTRPSSASTTPVSTSESVFETTTNGEKHTVTSFVVNAPASPTSTPAPPPKSFLQNKPLSGFVFALCGIVGLVLIILITTFALRRSRRKKLEREAVSYDPGRGSYNDDMETRLVDEKGGGGGDLLSPLARQGSQNSARTYGSPYVPNAQQGYYDQRIPAYGQYPNYAPRSPFEQQQQQMYPNYSATANYPGAPLPPRSPNPAYDPNAGRVSPTELHRSNTRSSNNSDSGAHAPSSPLPPLPTSLLNGAAAKSPPPVTTNRVPVPAQLPATFGGNGSIDERQGIPPIDLRVSGDQPTRVRVECTSGTPLPSILFCSPTPFILVEKWSRS